MGIPTYRPVLLADDIIHILSILRKEMPATKATQLAIAKLAMYEFKIKNNIIKPQYEVQSIEEKTIAKAQRVELDLGLDMSDSIDKAKQEQVSSIKDQKLAAFKKWEQNPQSCSVEELKLSSEYQVENGLNVDFDSMSIEEQLKYLSNL